MKTYGCSGWETLPSYLDELIPYVLGILNQLNLRITFFVVGQDALLEKNKCALKLITEKGHEIGNHSFHHEPWLHLYAKDILERQILETEENIIRITGKKPIGFRGPGFSWSKDLFEILSENGYIYDSTTFPTYIGSFAKAYYFRNPSLSIEEKNKRKKILGGFKDGMRPIKPYLWKLTNGERLLEIPVTTIPIIKTPFHMSYLLFLGRVSVFIMLSYLKIALTMCRLTWTEPSFVIHPTDLFGGDQVPDMKFFPGMDLTTDYKLYLFKRVIGELSKRYTLINMRSHAESILERNTLDIKYP